MAVLSVWDLEVGKALQFIVTSGSSALDLTGAVVTMLLDDGKTYPATIISAASGTVKYTTSSGDFLTHRNLIGQLRVSFGTNRYYTSTFELIIRKSIDQDPT
jgi:hypothetical protein